MMVALAEIVGDDAHGVLEAQRHTGIKVGLELGDGDIEGLAADDRGEDARDKDLLLDPGLGQDIAVDGLFFEGQKGAAPPRGQPV